jgi:two-component system, response regulator
LGIQRITEFHREIFSVFLPRVNDLCESLSNVLLGDTEVHRGALSSTEEITSEIVKGEMMEKKKVILLVEDNPDDVDLTLRAFQKNQSLNVVNELVVVRDGQEALDCLFGTGKFAGASISPSVILLDLKLPKVDGLEVLRRIRQNERTKLYPVVILTSSRQEQDLVKGYSLGANSYVQKPVDFDKFLEAVRQLGLYWLLLNEPPPAK